MQELGNQLVVKWLMRPRMTLGVVGLVAIGAIAAIWVTAGATSTGVKPDPIDPAIHKIRHIVVIMQENRSFDSYFTTLPM